MKMEFLLHQKESWKIISDIEFEEIVLKGGLLE
jgi:hypothetical protein